MKAAITAYDRGHKVTLIEKEAELGGMLRVIVKEGHKRGSSAFALLPYTNRKRDIEILLNTEATPDMVRAFNRIHC